MLRHRLSYANVMATVAVFIALGGGAYAASLAPKNSVNSAAIVDAQVKGADVAGNAVTGAKVQDASLTPTDVKNSAALPHGSQDVVTAGQYEAVDYPLSDATWTQQANEVDLLSGRVTYTLPDPCTTGGAPGVVRALVDGNTVASAWLQPGTTSADLSLDGGAVSLPTTGSATPHTMTVEAYDQCSGGGENMTVHSVNLQVMALR